MRYLTSLLTRDQFLLYISVLLWGFGISLFIHIQPLYVAQLGATPAQIGLALGLSGLAVTFLYIPVGLWTDRHERKSVLLASWILGTMATFAMAVAPDWRWYIPALAALLLSNFGLPAFLGYIAASDTAKNLNRTLAIIYSGLSLGSIISPAIGGWIGEQFGLRAIYLGAAVVCCLSTLAIWPLSPQRAEASLKPANPKQLLYNRQFMGHIVFFFLLFFAIDLGQVMTPKFLADVRGLSVSQIGWLGTIGSLGVVLLTLALGHIPGEHTSSLILGQLVALVALILLLSTPAVVFIGLAYFIHGSHLVIQPITVGRLASNLNPATMSFGLGFYQTAVQLALAASPYVAGLLYTGDPSWPLYAGAIGIAVTLLLTLTLPASAPARARPDTT